MRIRKCVGQEEFIKSVQLNAGRDLTGHRLEVYPSVVATFDFTTFCEYGNNASFFPVLWDPLMSPYEQKQVKEILLKRGASILPVFSRSSDRTNFTNRRSRVG